MQEHHLHAPGTEVGDGALDGLEALGPAEGRAREAAFERPLELDDATQLAQLRLRKRPWNVHSEAGVDSGPTGERLEDVQVRQLSMDL